jgi:hypothetical protein
VGLWEGDFVIAKVGFKVVGEDCVGSLVAVGTAVPTFFIVGVRVVFTVGFVVGW